MRLYGEFLNGRQEGRDSYLVIKRDFFDKEPEEKIFFDFSGVKVFAPSFCDEVFGELAQTELDRFFIDSNINHAIKMSFDTVENSRNIKFNYSNKTDFNSVD